MGPKVLAKQDSFEHLCQYLENFLLYRTSSFQIAIPKCIAELRGPDRRGVSNINEGPKKNGSNRAWYERDSGKKYRKRKQKSGAVSKVNKQVATF